MTDPKALARRAIACLDLTNLNDDCSQADIAGLCARAATRHGDTAAICIWPRFVALAKKQLGNSSIRIATVVNFPHGGEDTAPVIAETNAAIAAGADEIDMVMAYRLVADRPADVETQITAIHEAAPGALLKVILETGELKDAALIGKAAEIAIAAGADFIKTSTGKEAVNATLPVSLVMVRAIREYRRRTGVEIGFKPAASGPRPRCSTIWC